MSQKCSLIFRRNNFSELQNWLKQVKRQFQNNMKLRARCQQISFLTLLHIILPVRPLPTLKQMLQLEPGTEFDVMMPDLNNILITDESFSTDSVYNLASQVLPRLKEIEFELKLRKNRLQLQKEILLQVFPLVGSFLQDIMTLNFMILLRRSSYQQQMKDNFAQQVGVSLRLPIFNNYAYCKKSSNLPKLKRTITELRLEQEKNNLYTEIENACLNYNRGKRRIYSCQSKL